MIQQDTGAETTHYDILSFYIKKSDSLAAGTAVGAAKGAKTTWWRRERATSEETAVLSTLPELCVK